jgi:uvrD rep family helicase
MEKKKRFWTERRKREYIREAEDNLFIVAGPGTGKTTLLSKRILNQIMGGERLSHFLIIAFTEEAVQEFKQKIKKHLYREIAINKEDSHRLKKKLHGIDRMHIMTFNSFCLWVMEEDRKLRETERIKQLADVEEEIPLLEERCYTLLQKNKSLLQNLRRDFTKIYADELQDLNRTQLNILLSLATDKKGKMRHNCLFMVGDPRQTIYQEEEEARQVFFDMKRQMEKKRNVHVLYLNENYRANKMLVDWINGSFRKRIRPYRDMEASQRPEFIKHCPFHGIFHRNLSGDEGEALRKLLLEITGAYPELKDRDFLILCKTKERQEYFRKSLEGIGFSENALEHMVLEAHLSKSLNANIVIITGAGGESSALSESRFIRLEYVAVTRAKHALIFLRGGEVGEEWFSDKSYGLSALPEFELSKKEESCAISPEKE